MMPTEFRTGVIQPVECIKEGFELIKKDYWLLFGIVIVGALIGGFTMYVLFGAMFCGIFYAYLKVIDGKGVVFDDLWKGMQFFGPGLVVTLFIVVPIIVYYFGTYIALIFTVIGGAQLGESAVLGALLIVGIIDLIVLLAMVCFHTLLMFSFPLIVDRNLGAIDAMKLSARAVWANLGGILGLIVVNIGLVIVGYLALCIGVYFVIPIMMAGNAVAYRKVFPRLDQNAPYLVPPNAYGGMA